MQEIPPQNVPDPAQVMAQNAALTQQVAALQQQLQAAQTAAAAATAAAPRPSQAKIPDPPRFNGRGRQDINNWLFLVENSCAAHKYDEPTQLRYALALLDDLALVWWRSAMAGQQSWTWGLFRAAILQAFSPVDPVKTARERLDKLQQRDSPAAYYAMQFRQLVTQIPSMSEEDRIHRFVSGLRPAVAQQVKIQDPTSLEQAMVIAARADDRPRTFRSQSAEPQPMELGTRDTRPRRETKTYDNRRPRLSYEEIKKLQNAGRCFNCKQPGHIARNCPSKPKN